MKHYIYSLLLILSFTFFSCEMKKDLFGEVNKDKTENTTSGDQGLLDLELKPHKEVDVPDTKGGSISGSEVVVLDVNEFAVDILDEKGSIVKHYNSYADLKKEGGLFLPIGKYAIRATLGEDVNAGFDSPFYSGTNVCEITPKEVAKVITDCVLSNKKVKFRCSDQFLNSFKEDYSIVIDNKAGALITDNTDTRSAYLKSTGVLQFSIYATMRKSNKNVVYTYDLSKNEEVQDYNNIVIDLGLVDDAPPVDPDDPDQPGEPEDPGEPEIPETPTDTIVVKTPVIKVDISLVERDFIIEVPSDFVDAGDLDDDDEGGDGGDGEGDGGGEGDKPVAKPTIVGDGDLDISKPIDISGAGNKTVRVNISTPGKLESLNVKITSSVLEPLLPAVGLSPEFDICDKSLKTALDKLGLKANKGDISTVFDISGFMPMIAGLDSGNYIFTLTVTDQLGQKVSKKLTIRNLNK